VLETIPDEVEEEETMTEPTATRAPAAAPPVAETTALRPPAPEAPVPHVPPTTDELPPEPINPDVGADLPGFHLTQADRRLDAVFGDHPHHNDGRHLDGDIPQDLRWQRFWRRLAYISPTHYAAPKGRVGRRFVATLAREFKGVQARQWNSEHPLVFVSVVLQTTPGVKRARDIRQRLEQRMNLWDQGQFAALVDDTEAEVLGRVGTGLPPDEETKARAYNSRVLSGRLRSAVREITRRGDGGVLQPDSVCTKTGLPVLTVLREKHPPMRDPAPDLSDPDRGSFEPYEDTPHPLPVAITDEVVENVAARLSGAAGPGGTDAVDLRNWLLRFGVESEQLRTTLASLTEWLCNSHPPWAAYRAIMACRLVALDKCPGVRPVGIGEIYRRLMAKCVLAVIGHQATAAAGNLNLCAGLPAGIEGAVHAVNAVWSGGPTATSGGTPVPLQPVLPDADADVDATSAPTPPADGEDTLPQATQQDAPMATQQAASTQPDPPTLDDPIGCLLVDARNGFNELGRRAMLWSVRHLWAGGARFSFNCYRHAAQLILRKKGRTGHTLLSQEGVTQGDPLSMVLYGLALVPLANRLRLANPTLLQAWYADDMAMAGPSTEIAKMMGLLEELGPKRGYFPEPAKSIFIVRPEDQPQAQDHLSQYTFTYCEGHRYVGGFIGTNEAREAWLQPKVRQWADGVETLARVARRFPQTAYAGLAKSLQSEWQYLQRVLPDSATSFAPVEEALQKVFLPALFQEPEVGELRHLLSLAVSQAGVGISNPTLTADDAHRTSVACTSHLSTTLREGQDLDAQVHSRHVGTERRQSQRLRKKSGQASLAAVSAAAPKATQRRLSRARETGAWITSMPDSLNGTVLSAEEFRDSLRLRYGLKPHALPESCDGCGQRFSVGHALSCKKGGLVLLRHNDLVAEWHELSAQALTPSAVSDEPLIHSGQGGNGIRAAGTDPELRGDVAVHGFWRRGATAIFDVRITDTDAPTYRHQDPQKVLEKHEKEKKQKYNLACQARRRQFTPLVFSVDGLRGAEADAASRRLASRLAAKWKRTYSEVCGFVRSRLSVALVRTTSLCLRGSRDPTPRPSHATWDSGTGLSLYR
jgi:hypothetical protein